MADDSNRRPPRPRPMASSSSLGGGGGSEDRPATARRQSGLQPPSMHDAAGSRRLSPSPSRRSLNPPTPDAIADSDTEYFPPLRDIPTIRSQHSGVFPASRPVSAAGSDGVRPAQERTRQPSIRIRRRSSNSSIQNAPAPAEQPPSEASGSDTRQQSRPRSISQPLSSPAPAYTNASLARHSRRVPQIALPRLTEEGGRPSMAELGIAQSPISPTRSLPEDAEFGDEHRPSSAGAEIPGRKLSRKRRLSRLFWPGSNNRDSSAQPFDAAYVSNQRQDQLRSDEFDEELVDWLDIIDPEVQALSTLTNVQNSLFVPDLGGWLNRRPTYVLSQHATDTIPLPRTAGRHEERLPEGTDQSRVSTGVQAGAAPDTGESTRLRRSDTITSRLTESHYAALPHGFTLEGWTEAEKMELDDHVRHMLHSRRFRFKRTMKGFGQYVRRPLGFFVTLYATLITLFGLAWVLFLIGWIYVGTQQVYAIHIIDSVLVALFAVMGDGLAPFRAVDTYHMIFVVHYSRKISKAKKKKLKDSRSKESSQDRQRDSEYQNCVEMTETAYTSTDGLASHIAGDFDPASRTQSIDRPLSTISNLADDPRMVEQNADIEGVKDLEYDQDSPLSYKQWKRLRHHQKKLAKSHSFYKPDETFTHHAFPLDLLMAIVILLDCHSCLQISLGATTWGIDYHHRPFAITTVILCVSITCNLVAGLIITLGDRKTRKKDVINLLNRQELTGDAIKHLETKRAKDPSRSQDLGDEEHQQQEQDSILLKDEL